MYITIESYDSKVYLDVTSGFTGLTEIKLSDFLALSLDSCIINQENKEVYLSDFNEVAYCECANNAVIFFLNTIITLNKNVILCDSLNEIVSQLDLQ